MILTMSTVRITESELARDVHAVLEKVRQGVEVIVEQNHLPVAVIRASKPVGRKISECIAAASLSIRLHGISPRLQRADRRGA